MDAACFAAHRHQYQRRGGYPRLPYINHLLKVCYTLLEVGNVTDRDTLLASLLHDIMEDTTTTHHELSLHFSSKVADIVRELTDDMSLPYSERKALQVQGVTSLSLPAQRIRIVDKGSNMEDITTYPLNWTWKRKMVYVKFAEEVILPIRKQHPILVAWFDEQVIEAKARLAASNHSEGT